MDGTYGRVWEAGRSGELDQRQASRVGKWQGERKGLIFYMLADENRKQSKLDPGCVFVKVYQWPYWTEGLVHPA